MGWLLRQPRGIWENQEKTLKIAPVFRATQGKLYRNEGKVINPLKLFTTLWEQGQYNIFPCHFSPLSQGKGMDGKWGRPDSGMRCWEGAQEGWVCWASSQIELWWLQQWWELQHTQSLPWAGHWSTEGSVGWLCLLAGDGQGSGSSLLAWQLSALPSASPDPARESSENSEIQSPAVHWEETMRKQQCCESEKSLFTSLVEWMKAPNQLCLF